MVIMVQIFLKALKVIILMQVGKPYSKLEQCFQFYWSITSNVALISCFTFTTISEGGVVLFLFVCVGFGAGYVVCG
jgi:hypothetical protein